MEITSELDLLIQMPLPPDFADFAPIMEPTVLIQLLLAKRRGEAGESQIYRRGEAGETQIYRR